MMDKEELLQELKEKFAQVQKELEFRTSFEELNRIFAIEDAVLDVGFVSNNFDRQITGRIVEAFMNWNNYLHNLLMPNPQSLINMHESKIFQDKRQEIISLISEAMHFIARNMQIGLSRDKKEEGKFIDDSVKFWKEKFKPEISKIIDKVAADWGKKP